MNEFPRRFGPYVLLKPLARGGMGALYLALSGPDETAKLCVIKTVLPHLADKEYLQRFRDEAKVVVRLSHGNLVPVFDSGQAGGEIYLAMDYVEGRDLRATWNRCAKKGIAFPVDVAAHLVRELARGLYYAHTFGDIKLVHRDVSPPNVLLSYSGEVRLTDFGLAASTLKIEKTAPGIIYGKVSYMSPEQARGEQIDGRTDLYASGIILWELLTGRQLFPSTRAPGAPKDQITSDELLRRVRNPEIVPPSRRAARVPPELDRIAMKALAPDLKERYANCEDLRHDLAKFLAQTSPATDATRVAKFLGELYDEDIAAERAERDQLIARAREWHAAAVAPASAKSSSANTAPIENDHRTPADKFEPDTEERPQRETVLSIPVRFNKERAALPKPKPLQQLSTAERGALDPSGASMSSTVIGSVVGGRYYVRRLCGEGGMGRVYEAEHIDIGRRVALKILHPAYSQTPDLVERLRREARAASKIAHPNVVDVTDSGTTSDGAFFFVMEYLEGVELGELIYRQGKLDIARTLHIGAQICRALQAAHEVNVIHRDLKPENVLILNRDGQPDFVKVLDFGIAKSGNDGDFENERDTNGDPRRRLTSPGMTMGTPEYMAPEQAAGRPADPRSDIYAIGGLLYEMLSGNAPYEGSNFMEILHKKATTMPAALSTIRTDVPPELEGLIMRALAKEPDDRPRSMDEVGRELTSLANTLFPGFGYVPPVESEKLPQAGVMGALRDGAAQASGLYQMVRQNWRRKPIVIGAASALALVVGSVVTGLVVHRHHTHHHVAVTLPAAPSLPIAAPPPPVVPAPTPPPPPAAVADKEAADDEAEEDSPKDEAHADDSDTATKTKARPVGTTAAESKRMVEDAQRLLHAERFAEARALFEKLAKSKRDRRVAMLGLAEIAFQEKNYAEAVHSAQLAVERGGGVKARVLLGDAHFRLGQYKEAAKAYEDALKLEPGNASAKTGLSLAQKRM
jgi:serine/threonine protein kinase/predicted negative regulator of RcsB-dependent stress response